MASVFRKTALERLSSPDRLDSMLRLTSPLSWVGLAAAAALAVGVVVWSFAGRIPTTASGYGCLTYNAGTNGLYNTAAGTVDRLLVRPGDRVEAGMPVAEILGSSGELVTVEADQTGRIRDQLVELGETVVPNQALFRISPDSDSPLLLVCYVSRETARQLEPGMAADISLEQTGWGRLEGQVACVDRVQSTAEDMAAVLGYDEGTISALMNEGAVMAVTCTLREDETTASGYYFSSPAGAEAALYGGLPATAQIILDEKPPIAWVFPLFGGDA